MESRKMVLMNLFAGEQWGHRHREETCGQSSGFKVWIRSCHTVFETLQELHNTLKTKCPSSSQRSHIIWPTLASCCLVWTILGTHHAGHIGLPVYVTTSGTFLAQFFAHVLHLPYNASLPGTSVFTLISVKSLLKCISSERPCLTTFIWKSCQIPIFLY